MAILYRSVCLELGDQYHIMRSNVRTKSKDAIGRGLLAKTRKASDSVREQSAQSRRLQRHPEKLGYCREIRIEESQSSSIDTKCLRRKIIYFI